jgi:SAM-dependent methyltransferase
LIYAHSGSPAHSVLAVVERALNCGQLGCMNRLTLYDDPVLYDCVIRPGPCQAFYRDLARQTGDPILELACGTGRLTIPLARDGHEVVGLDTSAAMLRASQAKADFEDLGITFVQGDMRSLNLGRRFPLVILCCNSLAHLTTNEDLKTGLASVLKHLAPGGLFAFDVVNPDVRALARSHSECVRLDLGPNPSSAIAVEEVASYDPVQQIRIAQWRVLEADAAHEIGPLNLRVFFPQELPLLLEASGLELAARYGDFAGNSLTGDSLNQICIARLALASQLLL